MLGKIALIIVCVGACACALLAMRQSRLQAAHELARAQLRVTDHDAALWRVRAEIARRVTPEEIERLAGVIGPLRPMLPKDEGDATLTGAEADAPKTTDADAGGAAAGPTTPVIAPERERATGNTPAPRRENATPPARRTPGSGPGANPGVRPEAGPTRRSSPGREHRLAGGPGGAGGTP